MREFRLEVLDFVWWEMCLFFSGKNATSVEIPASCVLIPALAGGAFHITSDETRLGRQPCLQIFAYIPRVEKNAILLPMVLTQGCTQPKAAWAAWSQPINYIKLK